MNRLSFTMVAVVTAIACNPLAAQAAPQTTGSRQPANVGAIVSGAARAIAPIVGSAARNYAGSELLNFAYDRLTAPAPKPSPSPSPSSTPGPRKP